MITIKMSRIFFLSTVKVKPLRIYYQTQYTASGSTHMNKALIHIVTYYHIIRANSIFGDREVIIHRKTCLKFHCLIH